MPHAVEFHGCYIGCDFVHAHFANRKWGSLLYMLFVELKVSEAGPQSNTPPRPKKVVSGAAVDAGRAREVGYGGSSGALIPTISLVWQQHRVGGEC